MPQEKNQDKTTAKEQGPIVCTACRPSWLEHTEASFLLFLNIPRNGIGPHHPCFGRPKLSFPWFCWRLQLGRQEGILYLGVNISVRCSDLFVHDLRTPAAIILAARSTSALVVVLPTENRTVRRARLTATPLATRMGDATAFAPASEWHAAAVDASTFQPHPRRRAKPEGTEGKDALSVLGRTPDCLRSSAKLSTISAPNSD